MKNNTNCLKPTLPMHSSITCKVFFAFLMCVIMFNYIAKKCQKPVRIICPIKFRTYALYFVSLSLIDYNRNEVKQKDQKPRSFPVPYSVVLYCGFNITSYFRIMPEYIITKDCRRLNSFAYFIKIRTESKGSANAFIRQTLIRRHT